MVTEEVNWRTEVATLTHIAQSIHGRLINSSVSSHSARKLGDPVFRIFQMLETAAQSGVQVSWVREVSKAVYEASDFLDVQVADYRSKLSCCSLIGIRNSLKIKRLCNDFTQLCQPETNTTSVPHYLQQNISLLQIIRRDGGSTSHPQAVSPVSSPQAVSPVTLETDPIQEKLRHVNRNMTNVVGRDSVKEAVVNCLLDTSDPNQHIAVVSIVGLAGVGKTTLTRLVYNDERIRNHFDLKLWAHVSGNFDLTELLRIIIKSFSATSTLIDKLPLEKLISLLEVEINEKLFLLVLDDFWEKPSAILELKKLFRLGARGSKFLLTTRCEETVFDSNSIFQLKVLTDDDSWFLFTNIAFAQLDREPAIDLIDSLKSLVSRLRGIPLAVKASAELFKGKNLAEWQDMIRRMIGQLDPPFLENSQILPVLGLSYLHLPLTVKLCFVLCSLFPIPRDINIIDLVSLWMAHGFIELNSSRDMEDTAAQYFLDLINLSFFMNPKMNEYGNFVTSEMHDLIYDLALHAARGWGEMIHLSIHDGTDKTLLHRTSIKNDHKFQTFLCWITPDVDGMIGINDIVEMSQFKSLRVLDLHAFNIEMLPDSIGNLIHLRYLDLSHNEYLRKLPNSIANLLYLQTLKLEHCYELKELPTSFGKLHDLRRLELDGCENLTFMPPNFENLSSLRTLSRYLVGRPRFKSFSGLKSLDNLNHLRGRLMIEFSENWTTVVNEAAESNLKTKSRLTELVIKWWPTRHTGQADENKHEQLMIDGLVPPANLKGLKIEGYKGRDFPKWARGNQLATTLPNLITISIGGCGNSNTLPPFSRLQNLKFLSLHFMHNVQFFENSYNSSSTSELPFFPSLEELTLDSFYRLKGWWEGEMQMPPKSFIHLKKLKIWSCPELISMPSFPEVKFLDFQNINEKLIEFLTRPELKTSTLAPSSSSETSTSKPTEQSENFKPLKSLHIKRCPRLKKLAFASTSKWLTKLVVERLDMLSSLTEVLKQLEDLEELEIAGCKVLDLSGGCQGSCDVCEECKPWKNLSKLQHLTLRELPKLVSLPVGLRFIKTLRILSISTCTNFNALPECVRNLTSLQTLRLEGCPKLATLPEGLKEVRSLVKIDIIECSKLMERRREGGEDWHGIKQARVLCHKSWRYELMSDAGILQKPKNHGSNIVVCSEDPTIHVDVTVRRK